MRIRKMELPNFKRFASLTISDVPDTAKLVLVIGSNGSGKSSLFDASDWLKKRSYKNSNLFNLDESDNNFFREDSDVYYRKDIRKNITATVEFTDGKRVVYNDTEMTEGKELTRKFIGRSSIRIVPKILNTADTRQVSSDDESPESYIENDTRFINDVFLYIQSINNALREPVFRGKQADTLKIFRDFIELVNISLLKFFGGFNMKKHFSKKYLTQFKYSLSDLAKTVLF